MLTDLFDVQSWLAYVSPWLPTLVAAVITLVIALAACRLGMLLLRRAAHFSVIANATVDSAERPLRYAAPLYALQAVWQAAPDALVAVDSVRHLNGLLSIAATTWLAIRAIRGVATGIITDHPYDIDDNLQARRVMTQTRVLARSATLIALLAGLALMLMTFPGARQVGASLLASAGVVGLVVGLAAKPVFSNLIAGLQIALTQPIRIDDVLIVQDEWGRVEEITGTYVVLKIWDERRLVIPLQWFIENPFQNWTRTSSQLMGSVMFNVDFGMPVAALRAELERLMPTLDLWDGRFFNLQVTDTTERTMQLRVLVTAASSGKAFDLRCQVREALIDFMQREYPQYLPALRVSGTATLPPLPSTQRSPTADRASMRESLQGTSAPQAAAGLATSPGVPQS